MPARTSPTLHLHPLPQCCNLPVSESPSASIVVTSTLRVNGIMNQLSAHMASVERDLILYFEKE